jgi:hypothetical protein
MESCQDGLNLREHGTLAAQGKMIRSARSDRMVTEEEVLKKLREACLALRKL